jgi:hypothetical protein
MSPGLRPFLGVGGLALLFVAVASLVHKYRQVQADKMARSDRLLRGAGRIEQALARLERFGVPRELAESCRDELLARYRQVQELFPALPGLEERIRKIEQGLRPDAVTRDWTAPELADRAQLDTYTRGLTGLVDFFCEDGALATPDPGTRKALRERIRILRAEAHRGFRERVILSAAQAGEWRQALDEALLLLNFLRAKAPTSERGKALYQEAFALYQDVEQKRLPGQAEQSPQVDAA